jgi:hypothetical protein
MKRSAPTTISKPRKRIKSGGAYKVERWDSLMLDKILMLPSNDPSLDAMLRVIKTKINKDRMQVTYKRSEINIGRLYGTGLQSVSSFVRRLCSHKYYHDLDIKNCFPTILWQLIKKQGIKQSKYKVFRAYVLNREAVFDQVRKELNMPTLQDGILKRVFIAEMHHGDYTTLEIGLIERLPDCPTLNQFSKEIARVTSKLLSIAANQELKDRIWENEDNRNKHGTFIGLLCQVQEDKIIRTLDKFLTQHNYTVGVLVFDGLMVERKEEDASFPEVLLRQAEVFLKKECELEIQLVEKSLTPNASDMKRLDEEELKIPDGVKQNEAFEWMVKKLSFIACKACNNYKRLGDRLMKPLDTIPGVYVDAESAEDFINTNLRCDSVFHMRPCIKALVSWFETQDHYLFPRINSLREDVISFTNGVYYLYEGKFSPWEDVETPPLTAHYREIEYDAELCNKDTPLWDSLLKTQLHDNEVVNVMEILIGRLFYYTGFDNFQVLPFLKGDANTGKSTLIDLVSSMFPRTSVGVISANQEQTFGLETLYQKRLILSPDIPKNFSQVFNQYTFQSCISGEQVSIARKNKTAKSDVIWRVPMMLGGNHLPDYCDNSGSISRRLVPFVYDTLIVTRNTSMKADITATELNTVMMRCLHKYWQFQLDYKGKDFWDSVPNKLLQLKNEVQQSTNYLANFLANGDDYYDIIHVDDYHQTTSLMDLRKAFHNHMRISQNQKSYVMGKDYYPIKAAGYIMECANICKTCDKKSSFLGCSTHYSKKNRKRVNVIHNMKILKKGSEYVE